jgi:hypothetical protein
MINLYDHAVEKVYELVPGPKEKKTNSLNFRCFYCGDSKKSKFKKRAWIYRGDDNDVSFYCWNCRTTSRGWKLLSDLTGVPVKEVMKDILREYKDMSAKSLMDHVLKAEPSVQTSAKIEPLPQLNDHVINLRKTWVAITNNEDAVKFVMERMIHKAPFIPENWDLYYDTESGRIVIPWYRQKKLVYYQMRKIRGNSNKKYLFPMKSEIPNKDIYGLDYLDDDCPYIFYTEGVFDAIFVKNCIAVGGLVFTSYQERLLEPYLFNKQICLFPDNPWLDNASRDNIIQLASDRPNHLVYMWPKDCRYKDVNELAVETGNLNSFVDISAFEARILPAAKCKMMLKFGKDNV